MKTALERFEAKYTPEPNSGCWIWTGASIAGGYGSFIFGGGKTRSMPAHRAAWRMFCGEIPEGLEVCHSCDMPCCVNPDHLWLGTHSENMADCVRKGRFVYVTPARGSSAANAKLTEGQVREIKTRQLTRNEYADKFDIAPEYVNNIQSGRVWPHIVIDPALIRPPREQTKEQAKKAAYLREWKKRRAQAIAA